MMQESQSILAAIAASVQAYLQLEADSAKPAANTEVETGTAESI